MHHKAFLGNLTIAAAGSDSNILASKQLKMARALVLENANAAFTGTISLQASAEEEAVAGDMKPVYVDGVAVTVSALRIEQWNISPGSAVRIHSSGAEAAQRVVGVYAILDMI